MTHTALLPNLPQSLHVKEEEDPLLPSIVLAKLQMALFELMEQSSLVMHSLTLLCCTLQAHLFKKELHPNFFTLSSISTLFGQEAHGTRFLDPYSLSKDVGSVVHVSLKEQDKYENSELPEKTSL